MKKAVIYISVVLLVLAAAVELYVRSDAFTARVRSSLIGPIRAVLGEEAVIGKVKVNFIPLSLEVRDISLPDAGGKEAVAVRKVTAYVNPAALLKKELRLSYISVLEPRVYAVRAKDGGLNLTPIEERIKANIERMRSKGPPRFAVRMGRFSIRKGLLSITDAATTREFAVTGINMTAAAGEAGGRIHGIVRRARMRYSAPEHPVIEGAFSASLDYTGGIVAVRSAEFALGDTEFTASGTAGPWPDGELDLRVNVKSGPTIIKRIANFLRPARLQRISGAKVSATITGTVSAPAVRGELRVASLSYDGITLRDVALAASYRSGAVSLSGKNWKILWGDRKIVIDEMQAACAVRDGGLDITGLTARADDLSFSLDGRVEPSKGITASVSAGSSGKGRTLALFTKKPFEGTIGVTGKLTGPPSSPRFDGTLSAGPVTVRGVPFTSAQGVLEYANRKLRLTDADIREGASHYLLNGTVDLNGKKPVYSARLRVLRSDVVNIVALFYRQLPLRLRAEGEITFAGTAHDYDGTATLKLQSGSAYGESFDRGTVTAKLSTGMIAFPKVLLYKDKGTITGTGWIKFFERTYSAEIESRHVDLSSVDRLGGLPLEGDFSLDLYSSGSFTHPFVRASLGVGELCCLDTPLGGGYAAAEIKDGLLNISAGLSRDRAALSLKWNLKKKSYPWTATANVRPDAVDPLLLFWKGSQSFTNRVKVLGDSAMSLHGEGLDPSSIGGEIVFQHLSLVIGDYRIENEKPARLAVANGRINASDLNFTGPGTRIGITGWARPGAGIDVTIRGAANLSLLKLLYREVEYTEGAAEVKLTLKDRMNNPDIAGELLIRKGEVKVRDIPQRFADLNGKIVFTGSRIVVDSLSAGMGGGALNVSGWAQLEGIKLKEFTAKVAADGVTVRYPQGLVSTLSGDLYYDGDADEQSLSGDITIARARYDKRIEWKTMLVDISRGLYQKKKTDIGWIGETLINVRFHGANDILFKNNLATMDLNVDVFLRGTVNHPQLLGRIESRKGVVYFRKNEFKVLHASTDFTDPGRMNPVLDIQAETQVREYRIRLAVSGTAERAVVTFLSEPSLNDTDILSMLALGKRSSELKGKEESVGRGEGLAFATGSFQDFFERRARSLTGLDRFQVDPYVSKSDTSVPRVTVGKEIVQDKLYVTYSANVGAATPEQVFRIEYLLNRHYSLVGGSDDLGNPGADIKYRFEFR